MLCTASVVITPLKEDDVFLRDPINTAMFLRHATRPHVATQIFQRFGFADAIKGIAESCFDQIE